MQNYYGTDPLQKRLTLLKSDAAKPFIEEIIAGADEAAARVSPAFKMSEYMLYYSVGNRKIFEAGYFQRRRDCNNIMLALWLTQDEKYLVPLVDYIGYICDEFTWCVPAHCDLPSVFSEAAVGWVDLFQAETARLFAEIVMCVGDKLPDYITDRMKYEINRRIFVTLRDDENHREYWWENCKMNWATVCGAGCTMAALYFGTDEDKDFFVNKFTKCLDSYLEGIGDDGCCQEGMGYWNYGFFHFTVLAMVVKIYTGGKTDYFLNPKVKALALFPQNVRLCQSKVASISDGGENFRFKIGLMSFLKGMYPEVLLPDIQYATLRGNVDSVFELLWFDENYKGDAMPRGSVYLADAQWYVARKEGYSFVAKGGNNKEPHNHNDIGSFMITVGDSTFISDLGSGEYVKETFAPETRYTFVQNCSRGHSVPVVNGGYQCPGPEYCASNALEGEDSFELNIEGAYASGSIDSIRRRFEFSEDRVILRDTVEYSPDTISFTERFVSKIKPEIKSDCVDFGLGKICFDSNRYRTSVTTESFVAGNGKDRIVVYLVDFEAICKDEMVFEFEFVI